MTIRLTRWEVRFLRPDRSGQTIATYRVQAASRVDANAIGWAYFNRDHPAFNLGARVQTYELK